MNRNELVLTAEGAASTAYLILTQGALFTALALYFNLSAWWLGVSAAFPLAFQLLQLFAPPLVERSRNRPALLNIFNALRAVWLIPALAALAGYRSAALFIASFALSQAANAFAGNVWLCLCKDLVPEERRGSFFGRRNFILGIVSMAAVPAYLRLLELVAEPWNVFLVVALGMAGTALAMAATTFLRDARPAGRETPQLGQTMAPAQRLAEFARAALAPARDQGFKRLIVAFFFWSASVQFAAPFFALHQIRNLAMPYSVIGLAATATAVISMLSFRAWGKIADRAGHKSVLMVGLGVASSLPGLWFFMAEPLWPFILAVDVVMTGVGWSAVNLTLLTLPMESSEKADSSYFALMYALGGLGGLAGAILGGAAAELSMGWGWSLFGLRIEGLQILFLANSLMRVGAALLFRRVPTKRYVRPITLVENILSLLARRMALRPMESDGTSLLAAEPAPRENERGT
jgi:MFS family permease